MADGRTLLMIQVMIVFFLYLMGYHSAGQQLMGGWLCTPQSISIGFGNVSTGIPIACAGTGSAGRRSASRCVAGRHAWG